MFSGREFADIRKALDEYPIYDTHEHYGEEWASTNVTLYDLLRNCYVTWCTHPGPLEDRPEAVAPWLAPARYNSYTVSYLRGLTELFGLPVRDLETADFAALAEKVQAPREDPTWPLRVIRKAGIQQTIVDPIPNVGYLHGEPTFHLSLRSHALLRAFDRGATDHNEVSPFALAARMGCNISSFEDYLHFVDVWVSEHKKKGAVALKSALAYERDIEIGPVSYQEAAAIFDSGTQDPTEQKKFGDFIFNLLAQKAHQYGLVFQMHVGLAQQQHSHPWRLLWLLDNNPDTIFDLFHGGYPWLDDVLAMASERRNLIVDSCWLPIISPSAAVRFYSEYAEVAYRADSLCWGGDNWYPEETFGAVLTFKDCLAKAVADKVEGNYWTRREGLRYAEGVMWRAAGKWFGIGK